MKFVGSAWRNLALRRKWRDAYMNGYEEWESRASGSGKFSDAQCGSGVMPSRLMSSFWQDGHRLHVAGLAPWTAIVFVCAALAACGQADAPIVVGRDPADGDTAGISRVTEEGPVKVAVALTPAEPQLGDPLSLTLTVEAEEGVTVEMPAFGEALGRFSIVDFTPREETRPDGVWVGSQRYTLQPPMSGRQRIPPLRIEYLDARPGYADGDEEYRELLSEELVIEVASVLPEGEVVAELRPVRPPLPELGPGFIARAWPWLVAGAVGLAGLGFAAALWQRRAAERRRVTAWDRAMRRLEALAGRGLPSPDAADAWYVELSDIVRRYIEDQYGVRAPELTTEEFLQEARRSADLSGARRELLSAFLERCDRVKFAAYSPERRESDEALTLARRFLGEPPSTPEPELAQAV